MMSLTKINPRGQITIPAKFRNILHCKPGDYVEVKMEGNILKVIPKELIDKSQMWFWAKEHQKAEEEAELELQQGKGKEVKNVRELIDELNK
jgi:AbrB family looped-hinge helix DNA binding protein